MYLTKVDEAIMSLCFLEEAPDCGAALKNDLGIDSLKIVELIVELEKSYGIFFNEGDLDFDKLVTVRNIYELLNKYVEAD